MSAATAEKRPAEDLLSRVMRAKAWKALLTA
jgi:hypothetical protein